MPAEEHVPVLIVGAGPTGLVSSILLSRFGVESLTIDRDDSTADHPQAHVINGRSMEIFRMLGVDDAIRAEALQMETGGFVRWVESVGGREFAHIPTGPPADDIPMIIESTPAMPASTAQDRVEPILLELASTGPGRVEFSTTLVDLTQDDAGVIATVESEGTTRRIRADYVIGSDGAGSKTRRLADIDMIGPEMVARVVGIYFHADMGELVAKRPAVLYWTIDADMPGTFIAMDGRHRWVYHAPAMEEPFDLDAYDDTRCQEILRGAIGDDSVAIDIRSVRPWVMTAQIAARYRNGRVFLAGDAAHRFPPTGGFGMNTGVQDAHNLAWKLAAVLHHDASPDLLDSYERERKPVAEENADWSMRNAMGLGEIMGPGAQMQAVALANGGVTFDQLSEKIQTIADRERAHFGSFGRDLGFHYRAGAIVDDGTSPPEYDNPDTQYFQNATPGGRAPHLGVVRGDELLSTIDVFDGQWTLLSGPDSAPAWRMAAEAQQLAVSPVAFGVDLIDPADRFAELFGIDDGAVLVRPDGHTAWRTATLPDDPAAALGAALAEILEKETA